MTLNTRIEPEIVALVLIIIGAVISKFVLGFSTATVTHTSFFLLMLISFYQDARIEEENREAGEPPTPEPFFPAP